MMAEAIPIQFEDLHDNFSLLRPDLQFDRLHFRPTVQPFPAWVLDRYVPVSVNTTVGEIAVEYTASLSTANLLSERSAESLILLTAGYEQLAKVRIAGVETPISKMQENTCLFQQVAKWQGMR
jgi:hypothetical protein